MSSCVDIMFYEKTGCVPVVSSGVPNSYNAFTNSNSNIGSFGMHTGRSSSHLLAALSLSLSPISPGAKTLTPLLPCISSSRSHRESMMISLDAVSSDISAVAATAALAVDGGVANSLIQRLVLHPPNLGESQEKGYPHSTSSMEPTSSPDKSQVLELEKRGSLGQNQGGHQYYHYDHKKLKQQSIAAVPGPPSNDRIEAGNLRIPNLNLSLQVDRKPHVTSKNFTLGWGGGGSGSGGGFGNRIAGATNTLSSPLAATMITKLKPTKQ
jgi:hypothetical protein